MTMCFLSVVPNVVKFLDITKSGKKEEYQEYTSVSSILSTITWV